MTLVLKPAEIYAKREAEGRLGLLSYNPEWSTAPLGTLIDLINGAPFDSNLFNRDKRGKPLIRIRDVGKDDTETWFNGEFEDRYLVRQGDLLVGLDGDFRAAEWRGEEALLNQRVCKLVPKTELLDQRFMLHHLAGWLDAIWEETSATTVKHLSSKTIQEIPFPVPPLDEQKRIVEALDNHLARLDKALADLNHADSQTLVFRRSIFNSLLNPQVSEAEPGVESITSLPTGWVSKCLGDIAQVTMGQSPPGSSYNQNGQGIPFFQGKAEFGTKHPTVRQWTTAGTKFVESGDILMSVRAPVGPTNIADTHCAIGRGLAGIRAGATLDQAYLIWYLKHVEASIQSRGKGTTFDAISGNDLRDTVVSLPPLDEQRRIVETLDDHLSRLDSTRKSIESQRSSIQTMRRSLLNKAFNGELGTN